MRKFSEILITLLFCVSVFASCGSEAYSHPESEIEDIMLYAEIFNSALEKTLDENDASVSEEWYEEYSISSDYESVKNMLIEHIAVEKALGADKISASTAGEAFMSEYNYVKAEENEEYLNTLSVIDEKGITEDEYIALGKKYALYFYNRTLLMQQWYKENGYGPNTNENLEAQFNEYVKKLAKDISVDVDD